MVSVEYFAYIDDPTPIPVALLAEGCRNRGYDVRVLREFTDWSAFRIVTDGVVQSGDMVCGWMLAVPAASAMATALECRASRELAVNEAAGRMGLFEVEVWSDPTTFNADLGSEAEGYGAGYEDARAASATRWYVRVASGSGELSAVLPETVLSCVLEQRGGVFDNPQKSEFRLVSRQL